MKIRKERIIIYVLSFIILNYALKKHIELKFVSSLQAETVRSKIQSNKVQTSETVNKESVVILNKKETSMDFSELSFDEQYCYLKKNYPSLNIPLNSEIQLNSAIDEKLNQISIYYINENRCPSGKYSILKMNNMGQMISYLDCERASLTELFLNTQFQYRVEQFQNYDPTELQLAAIGSGYFLVMCRDDHNFYITRKGNFQYSDGLLVNEDNCFLSAQNGFIALLKEPEFPDENGCFHKNGVCIATVDSKNYRADDFQFLDKEYSKFAYRKYDKKLKKTKGLKILNNAKENRYDEFSSELGLPEWRYADIHYPPQTCQ